MKKFFFLLFSLLLVFVLQFYTWVFSIGAEYAITKRCFFKISIGHENGNDIRWIGNIGNSALMFQYDYTPPFYLEPSVLLYF